MIAPVVLEGVIIALSHVLQPVAFGIDLAIRKRPGNLGKWVQDVAQRVFEENGKRYNVMVIRENHLARDWRNHCHVIRTCHIEFEGSGLGNDWGSIGYRAIVLGNGGYIENHGDGGFINWCFIGGRKDGNIARF